MRARIAASIVLAAGIALGTGGCAFMAPQATTIHYDASDGVGADLGDLDIRNTILISDDGIDANLVVTVVNTGNLDKTLNVEWETGRGELLIPAFSTVQIGQGENTLVLTDLDVIPGSDMVLYFQAGEATGQELNVPILTTNLTEYADFGPTRAPSTPAPDTTIIRPTTEPVTPE